MKPVTTGTVSGCVVWLVLFGLLGMCLVPLAFILGGAASGSEFAMHTFGPILCPKGTTGTSYSYPTTSQDSNGFPIEATAYELHCVDAAGEAIKEDPIVFAFLWEGIAVAVALISMAALAFGLAAPAGILVARLFKPGSSSRR